MKAVVLKKFNIIFWHPAKMMQIYEQYHAQRVLACLVTQQDLAQDNNVGLMIIFFSLLFFPLSIGADAKLEKKNRG